LLSEEEVVTYLQERHAFSAIEKFLQEVCWRTYWKGWLAQRPGVWRDAVVLASHAPCGLALRVMQGDSGCAVMDDFTNELKESGYLHNHARMWWAAFWVHHLQLPWALGADFFMQHLLDADPASNTLSWRWVAGLHTAGKTYLARPDNIARYHPQHRAQGLHELANTRSHIPTDSADLTVHALPRWATDISGQANDCCLLLHAEDLSVELSVAAGLQPQSIALVDVRADPCSAARHAWLDHALDDAVSRAEKHYGKKVERFTQLGALVEWLSREAPRCVVSMAPQVGHLADAFAAESRMAEHPIVWLQREWDRDFQPAARSGFFSFWKKVGSSPLFRSGERQMEFPM
jgi:deoxyribodipyrimidine photo-lyase